MNTKQVLIAARARITNPEHWTQGAYARDCKGEPVTPSSSPTAKCWCAAGSIAFVLSDEAEITLCGDALNALEQHTQGLRLTGFNDTRSHTEVLEAFDKAIASLTD